MGFNLKLHPVRLSLPFSSKPNGEFRGTRRTLTAGHFALRYKRSLSCSFKKELMRPST